MSNIDERIAKIKEFYDSVEGQAELDSWVTQIANEKNILNKQLARFHTKYHDNLDFVIERVSQKYNNKVYREKEYNLGYEPREPLYWFLFAYAEKYCVVCEDDNHTNYFTRIAYYIGSYVIQVMDGQGSVVRLEKHDG